MPALVITKKDKKELSKDMKAALKSKRRVSSFIEKTRKVSRKEEDKMEGEEGNDIVEEVTLSNSSGSDLEIEEMQTESEVVRNREGSTGSSSDSDVNIVSQSEDLSKGRRVTPKGPSWTNVSPRKVYDDDNDEEEDEDASTNVMVPFMKKFSDGISYRKLECNSILVSIEPLKKLYFTGKALVQVLKGEVDISGFTFGADGNKYAAFSAKGHSSLLSITSLPVRSGGHSTTPTRTSEHPNVSSEEMDCSFGALIIMEGFENEWCEGFRHLYPQASNLIGPSITGIGPGKTPKQSTLLDKLGFQLLASSKNQRVLEFPPYFEEIFTDLIQKFDCSSGKICPFGGQGVGKSTFLKWLVNRFLSVSPIKKVLYIDLDPGQSEFTPPGMLSVHLCSEPLLGPNFSHMKDPIRAIYVGGVNMGDVPVSYIKGVAELIGFCSSSIEFEGIPWVINTMGFSTGLGVHFACEIIKIIRPRCVIQIQIDNDSRSFPFFLNKDNVASHKNFLSAHLPARFQDPLDDYHFISVKSACNRDDSSNTRGWGIDRKMARKLMLISYFAEKVGNSEGFTLQSVIPFWVPLNSIAVGTINSTISYDEIISTLNGNLVALCSMPEDSFRIHDEGSTKKYITKAGNRSNECVGYGLVRAYDKSSDTLFVITPLQDTDVRKVNVILAAGAIGIPVNFYIGPNSAKENNEIPYVMSRKEGTSTLHTAAKKFFVPKRVTHSVLRNCLL